MKAGDFTKNGSLPAAALSVLSSELLTQHEGAHSLCNSSGSSQVLRFKYPVKKPTRILNKARTNIGLRATASQQISQIINAQNDENLKENSEQAHQKSY